MQPWPRACTKISRPCAVSAVLSLKRDAGQGKETVKIRPAKRLILPEQTEPYRLCAIVVHLGPIVTSGHYTAYVRAENDRRLYCDDALTPRVVPFQEVSDAEAYVLMYERESNEEDAFFVPTVVVD